MSLISSLRAWQDGRDTGWGRQAAPAVALAFLLLALALVLAPSTAAETIPTFSIVSVVADTSVTIRTASFPANQNFTVTMGLMGTQGVNGTVVGTTNSGAGGSFTATYNIPAALRGQALIAIRLQSPPGYYAYNWFHNSTGGGAPPPPPAATATPGSVIIPTFAIVSAVADTSVTIRTSNFPANQTFTVTMGPFGTQGVGGAVVGSQASGAGGSFTSTFNFPAALRGLSRIAIRLQSPQGYFAYNWFFNTTSAAATPPPAATATPAPTATPGGSTTIPTFSITAVTRNQSVTISARNFPPNQTFAVTLGPFGAQGVGGTAVGAQSSGAGSFTATYTIPAALANLDRIAIRLQSTQGYFAYNWFFNNTTP